MSRVHYLRISNKALQLPRKRFLMTIGAGPLPESATLRRCPAKLCERYRTAGHAVVDSTSPIRIITVSILINNHADVFRLHKDCTLCWLIRGIEKPDLLIETLLSYWCPAFVERRMSRKSDKNASAVLLFYKLVLARSLQR